MRPRIIKVGHVGITVRDLDRTIEFYSKYLGLKLSERFNYQEQRIGHGKAVAEAAFMRCDVTHHELSIFRMRTDIIPADAPDAPPYRFGLHHIAFELASPKDLLDLYKAMKDGGVAIVDARKGGPGNQPRFYARDPDGNMLEFYWGIDMIGWDNAPRPFDPIEEIDLLGFDFDGYVARREADSNEARPKIRSGLNPQ